MNNIEHPDINNAELLNAREMAEKLVSDLKVEIGKLESFNDDPEVSNEEKAEIAGQIEDIKIKLEEAQLAKAGLDEKYSAELDAKLKEIEESFKENYPEAA